MTDPATKDTEDVATGVHVEKEMAIGDVEGVGEVIDIDDEDDGVEVADDANAGSQKEPTANSIKYCDHYSLQYPSSTVRFRTSTASHRVYEGNRSQMILEDRGDQVVVKRSRDTTAGVYCLRATYTVVTLLWSGFLFIFCTQLLIFLVMDLAVYMGATTGSQLNVGRLIGTLLSFPVFVHGLATALIIDGHFVADTWAGQYLLKTLVFGQFGSVMTAWITFGFYLGLPLLVMCICLFAGIEEFWKITALFWFASIAAFYVLFVFVIVYFEIKACLEITGNEFGCGDNKAALLKKCILMRQVHTYSAYKSRTFLNRGSLREVNRVNESVVERTEHYHQSSLARFKKWRFLQRLGLYERIPEPGQRLYPIEECSGVRTFITYNTWSLEKLYCKPRNSYYVAVIQGPAALTREQMRSSFACKIIGILLTCLIIISLLVWNNAGATLIGAIVALLVVCCFPSIRSTVQLYGMAKDLIGINAPPSPTRGTHNHIQDDTDESEDEEAVEESQMGLTGMQDSVGVYQVCVTYLTAKATDRLCWIMFAVEIGLLFLFPWIALLLTGDVGIGVIFLVIGGLSLCRYYMNVGIVLEEVGNLHALQGKDAHRKWQNRSRTNDIVTNVTRSRSRGPWIIVLAFFFILCLGLVISGMTQGDSQSQGSVDINLVPGFAYVRDENTLPYPTCSLDFNFDGPSDGVVNTIDFAFLASIAYETNATRQQEFYDAWFGEGKAINMPEVVSEFRTETQRVTSPVTYFLTSFSNVSSTGDPVAVVSIRGSQTSWDWLTNAQLWSAALGMQFLQSFLPFGFVWRPIMDELVNAIAIVESKSIKRVSYYVETTDFVQWLQASGTYADVKVSGHSLGGGLSIITAAQTGVSGVAISGPNAMLSRKAFAPPVSEDDLNRVTFNVIPNRDVVPRVGGVANLFENVECTAPYQDVFGCHTSTRTLCELMYKCGSEDRPPLCQCVTDFGYPEPTSTTGESFAEACAISG